MGRRMRPPTLLQSILILSGLSKIWHCCMKGRGSAFFSRYAVFRDCRYSMTPVFGIFHILPMRNAFSSPECKSLYAVLRPIIKVSQSSSNVSSSVLVLSKITLLLYMAYYWYVACSSEIRRYSQLHFDGIAGSLRHFNVSKQSYKSVIKICSDRCPNI